MQADRVGMRSRALSIVGLFYIVITMNFERSIICATISDLRFRNSKQTCPQRAIESAEDNEKLAFWMQAFEREAAGWRAGVDEARIAC